MFPWAKAIYVTAGFGVFVLYNGYRAQNDSTFARQVCRAAEGCLHPEWIFVGLACLIGAVIMYFSKDPWTRS